MTSSISPSVRVLVTGGAGFIGSHLCERLVRDGHDVTVIDNLSTGRKGNLSGLRGHRAVRLVKGDIRNHVMTTRVMQGIEAVVHLAAIISVPYSISHPITTNQVNVDGTVNLLSSACKRHVSKFVNISSCAVYGEAKRLPIDEQHPKAPLSPYAASKLCSEIYCEAFHEAYGLDTTVLRLFNVYGPRQEGNPYAGVIVQFKERLMKGTPPLVYGDGKQTRDFVHVYDVVEAICECLEDRRTGVKVFNIGSGSPTSISELADLMSALSQTNVRPVYSSPRQGDILHSYADITKARTELGYQPRVSLEEGLRMIMRKLDNAKSMRE